MHEEGDRVDREKLLKAVEDKWINVSAPCMPSLTLLIPNQAEHWHFLAEIDYSFNLLVAETITRTQRKQIPKAQAACNTELEKLLKRSTWDPYTICEWIFVASESKRTGIKVHVAKMLKFALSGAQNLMTEIPVIFSRVELCSMGLG